jgi:peptide chain release factor 2
LNAFSALERDLKDATELISLAEAESDASLLADAEASLKDLKARAAEMEVESLLAGEADANGAYLEIHAGAGGTESQDWAEMLMRMYTRWAERRGYRVGVIQYSAGEGAGLKSVTLEITGEDVYGWLKTESGVHRLVRISPFDANARRHTSFASVWVYPVVDDEIAVEILDKDLKVDTYRSSGAGGQHVNTTDSAIRITHVPTGIVVACQNERSQHKNRAQAMKMLKARLYERELQKREEAEAKTQAAKTDIGWGHQIRSYVLQPYQMVKDLRTGVQSGQPDVVLAGEIDPFLRAALANRVTGERQAKVKDLE